MNIVTFDQVEKWLNSNPKYSRFKNNKEFLVLLYEENNKNDFINYVPDSEPASLGGQEVSIDKKEKILQYTVQKSLGFLKKNKFNWKQSSYYVGLNPEILRHALYHNYIVQVNAKPNAFLVKKHGNYSPVKGPLFINCKTMRTVIQSDWIIEIPKDNSRVFAFPLYLTHRKLELAKNEDKTTLDDF